MRALLAPLFLRYAYYASVFLRHDIATDSARAMVTRAADIRFFCAYATRLFRLPLLRDNAICCLRRAAIYA